MIACEIFSHVYFAKPPESLSCAYLHSRVIFGFSGTILGFKNKCWDQAGFGLVVSGQVHASKGGPFKTPLCPTISMSFSSVDNSRMSVTKKRFQETTTVFEEKGCQIVPQS